MLVNFTTVQNIFSSRGSIFVGSFVVIPICVVGIDGLTSVVSDKYDLDLFSEPSSCFVGEKRLRQSFIIGS